MEEGKIDAKDIPVALSRESLEKDLQELRDSRSQSKQQKMRRRDNYSLVIEERTKNPFMKEFGKSKYFSPSNGVIHRDSVFPNSPSVDGGLY